MKLLILLLLLLATSAQAATYWVHPSGNNGACTNTTTPQGSGGNAKTTITAGIACLASGDTLMIRGGTYAETITNVMFNGKSGSSWATATTVQAYGTEAVRFTGIGFNSDDPTPTRYIIFKGDSTARNLSFGPTSLGQVQNTQTIDHIKLDSVDVNNVSVNPGSNTFLIAIQDCPGNSYCQNPDGSGNSSVSDIWITNSKLHDTSNDLNHGCDYAIYKHGAPRSIIEGNEIYNTSGYGIHQWWSNDHDTIYRNNYFHDTGLAVNDPGSFCPTSFALLVGWEPSDPNNTGKNNLVYNNIFENVQNGIDMKGEGNRVYNNTFYKVGNGRVNCQPSGRCYPTINSNNNAGVNYISNNIIYDSAQNFIDVLNGSVTTNLTTGNPFFLNAAGGDFRLTSNSTAAINQGTNLGPTYSPDAAGVARPTSGPWDIGAYETGNTFWVSTSGTDGQCTNSSTPQTTGAERTINAGLSCMAGGDTLMIKGGTYTDTGLVVPSGTSGAHTIIRAATGETVTFASGGGFDFYTTGRQYVDIVGTCTTGLSRTCTMNFSGTSAGFAFNKVVNGGSTNITIDGVRITGNDFTAMNIASTNITFRNCRVDNNGKVLDGSSQAGYAFYIGGDNNTVENCELDNQGGYAIHQYSSDQSPSNNTYRNNFIHNNGQTIAPGNTADGILMNGVGGTSNNRAYGNVIWGNRRGYGVEVGAQCSSCLVYNNTIYDNGADVGAAGIATSGTNTLVTNNISSGNNNGGVQFFDFGTGTVFTTNLCSVAGTGCAFNESASATFVTPGSNFHIKAGSTAINAGTNLGSTYSPDYAGVARPSSGPWEIGAYEFISGVTPNVVITVPTSAATYSTSSATVGVSGSSTQSGGSVTWSCDRCTPSTGTATGTVGWSLPTLTLKVGINILTVTGTTALGDSGADTLTITYAPTFPGNTLVAAFPFDEGSGITTTDSSGNSNTGTLINSPTWAGPSGGRYGNAVIFNGIDQYIRVLDSNSLDLTQSFTLSLWVQPTAAGNDFRSLLEKNASGGAPPPFQFFASILGYCGTGGIGGFISANGSSGPAVNACTPTPLQLPGIWTHLALTYNGANLKLYRQGVLIDTTPITGYIEPSTGILQIAASEFGEYFEGLIDEVRIYNFALPLTGGANTVFGNNCTRADEINIATASIIGDANCPISAPVSPLPIKLGASATGLKLGAGATTKFGSTSGAQ